MYRLADNELTALTPTHFSDQNILERRDLQQAIKANIGAIAPKCMVIDEEYCNWEDSKRRIDLLCVDKRGNLVVVELKRTETGNYMELQAIRYASFIKALTFENVVDAHRGYKMKMGKELGDPEKEILGFLEWGEPAEQEFNQTQRIILASADFSKELTTSVLWLNENGLDITCMRMVPYEYQQQIFLNCEQLLPLAEATDYLVAIAAKKVQERLARKTGDARSVLKFWIQDLTTGVRQESLSFRSAAFEATKILVKAGAPSERIRELLKRDKRWQEIPGQLSPSEYATQLALRKGRNGGRIDPAKFFCQEGELFTVGENTCAVTSQWSGRNVVLLLDRYKSAYPSAIAGGVESQEDEADSTDEADAE